MDDDQNSDENQSLRSGGGVGDDGAPSRGTETPLNLGSAVASEIPKSGDAGKPEKKLKNQKRNQDRGKLPKTDDTPPQPQVPCEVCGRDFSSGQALGGHIKTHNKKRSKKISSHSKTSTKKRRIQDSEAGNQKKKKKEQYKSLRIRASRGPWNSISMKDFSEEDSDQEEAPGNENCKWTAKNLEDHSDDSGDDDQRVGHKQTSTWISGRS